MGELQTSRRDAPLARSFFNEDPFSLLRDRMDRVFRDVLRDSPTLTNELGVWGEAPRTDVAMDAEKVRVVAELPGVEEKDIEVRVDRDSLVLTGEKKSEKEEKGRDWIRRERSFGKFQRVVALPADVAFDKAEAKFSKGVLTVEIPRKVDEKNRPRTVPVKAV